jgi:peptide/nickel transport system ATP-binding protein
MTGIPGNPPALLDPPPGCRFAPRCPLATGVCRTVTPLRRQLGPARLVACHHAEPDAGEHPAKGTLVGSPA